MDKTTIILSDGSSSEERIPKLPNFGSFDDSLVDLHSLANSIFLAERHSGGPKTISRLEIPLRNGLSSEVSSPLEDLFLRLFGYYPVFAAGRYMAPLFGFSGDTHWSDLHTCLFSCGMDSYSGILSASEQFPVEGAFTLHSDFHTLSSRARALSKKALDPAGIELRTISAPRHSSTTRMTRGVLYVLNAVLLGNRNIIVPEIGPTMFQPPFTLLDEISVTTRPHILQSAKRIAEAVTGQSITIIKPNEDLTKAEVAAASPMPEYLKETYSCRSTSFADSSAPHCGSCYGCVVRRFAVEVAGVPDRRYRADGLTGEGADNTAHLLRFSADLLSDPESLPQYTTEIIEKYGKQDLFERFALDNLSGFLSMSEKSTDNPLQRRLVELVLRAADQDALVERIESVRDHKLKPNFGNKL